MKICDITKFYAETSGGVKTYITAKARYLMERKGWEHVLIVPGSEDQVIDSGQSRTYLIKGPLIPSYAPYRFLFNPWKVRAVLERERPDIVEIGSPYLVPWVTWLALSGLTWKPAVIGFYHADFPGTYVREFTRPLGETLSVGAERLAWWYARALYNGCTLTLAASPHLVETLTAHGIRRVRRVSLGVDLHLFHPARRDPDFKQRLGLQADHTLLLYVGRLATEKGISTLLDGFVRLPQERYRLLVVGDGPCRPDVETHARTHPTILYAGYETNRERLATVYASSDLFITPSPQEPFGLTVLEAQASGLPVVGVRGGAIANHVPAEAGALARPSDATDLAVTIAQTAARDQAAMRRAARLNAEERFDWNTVLEDLIRAYEEAVKSDE
ncbi:MAG: glycosyltransferase family 1 protein [Candidatus Latescibacteria bacterium]|nr:glycosyltransferase family 1 protein [Candidatus Latescibacterota bacterium]